MVATSCTMAYHFSKEKPASRPFFMLALSIIALRMKKRPICRLFISKNERAKASWIRTVGSQSRSDFSERSGEFPVGRLNGFN